MYRPNPIWTWMDSRILATNKYMNLNQHNRQVVKFFEWAKCPTPKKIKFFQQT